MDKAIVKDLFKQVRNKEPLVHHLTNVVTINDCANITLAIGASPVMATSIEEVAEMARLADALVINLGTIHAEVYESMIVAGQAANQKGIPVILDPVGVGATSFRTEKAQDFLQRVKVSIIRGNMTEIYALIGGVSKTRGVDAGEVSDISLSELAVKAACQLKTIIVISGEKDIICDGQQQALIENGDIWLTKITGTGCMTTSLIASFAGVTNDYFHAAVAGMSSMSIAGGNAKKTLVETDGIGTYRVKLMDEIFKMNGQIWEECVRLTGREI